MIDTVVCLHLTLTPALTCPRPQSVSNCCQRTFFAWQAGVTEIRSNEPWFERRGIRWPRQPEVAACSF